ncbi:CGNR zinc finger domain-containing protein [Actinomadura xylanilytica]|uniref:CGNR zinc finger domain-containing protein n=1 Tax=Actinomadura xylanilytica TaxID=887459 RepID=UPI00255AB247|nr:CGNR zinc finger domain-containing protein [Actinomadura xylanilytica]MDL4771473.1 CGNR zinc finger domain-containing protein [Actinomadura xylanilytica]
MADTDPAGADAADPDAAALLRDFVNTLEIDCASDELGTPTGLAGWLAGRALVPPQAAATGADLAAAIALREGLRAAMLAHHGPSSPGPPLSGLDAALRDLPLRVTFAGGRPALTPIGDGVPAGLARIAAAIVDATASGTWTRLKVCQEDTCLWAFLDTSKNRSRAWCSMRVCGNRTKTRAYRARRRTAPG